MIIETQQHTHICDRNVDRIFAMWQALNPNSYVAPVSNPYSTYTIPSNTVADVNTRKSPRYSSSLSPTQNLLALHPFHRDDSGAFWTSDMVRSTTTFAYTYPELVGLRNNDTSSLVGKINALYGPNATPQFSKRTLETRGIAGAPNFSGERHYMANIRVHKFGLDGSFNVYIFLGAEPCSEPSEWTKDISFIGTTGILAQTGVRDADNSGREANSVVPLTAALEARVRSGDLRSMKEDSVAAYLKQNLKWRISKVSASMLSVTPFDAVSPPLVTSKHII